MLNQEMYSIIYTIQIKGCINAPMHSQWLKGQQNNLQPGSVQDRSRRINKYSGKLNVYQAASNNFVEKPECNFQ